MHVVVDCRDAEALSAFWERALDYGRRGAAAQYVVLEPADAASGPRLIFQQVDEPKTAKNRVHFDVTADDIEAEANRLAALGAERVDEKPIEELGTAWIRMLDPEGNEFCVCRS